MPLRMPTCSSVSTPTNVLSKRITTDSPHCTGMVEIRTSTLWSRMRTLQRPSCGRRFSEMSRLAMSLIRVASAPAMRRSAIVCTRSTPSWRKRMRSSPFLRLNVSVGSVHL